MKKIIYAMFFPILFAGCTTNLDNPPFSSYLRFKADGVQTECTEHIRATYLPPTISPDKVITISGDWAGGSISLYLNEPDVLGARQYLFEPFTWRTGECWVSGPSARYYIGGSCLGCSSVTGSGKITFLEINPGYVRGTFEFVTGIDPATNTFKTVTNGEFHINRY